MTYLQILNIIKDTALAQPNVNSVVREFLDLNREDAKYSAVVIQDRDGSRDRIVEQDYVTYTWHLGYVDRLTYDESNRDDIISTGINIINNIVNTIRNTWFPELEVSVIDRINTFDQRFTAQCAGVYVVLAVNAQVSDCIDSESTDLYDTYDAKITANGVYHFVPSGRPVDEINITVDVEGSGKKEVSLTDTVTMNGTHSYIPEEDTVYKDVELTVDVHPTERLVQTYTTNGTKTITGEFNGGEITVDVDTDTVWGKITGNITDQTDLVDYVTGKDNDIKSWVSEQSYLTSLSLNGYATESWVTSQGYITSIPDTYATKTWVSEQGYLTSLSLNGYATESWVSSQQFATQSWVSSQGYLTEHQDLTGYATESWVTSQGYITSIPDTYATKTWVSEQGYLVNDSIDPYATCGWVQERGYATESWIEAEGYIKSTSLSGYATQSWVSEQGYLTSLSLDGYATQSWVSSQGYITSIPETFATKDWVSSQGYITSIPDTYATKTWVSEQGYLTSLSLNGYATESWVSSQQFATQSWVSSQGYLTSIPSEYATQSWATSQFLEESKVWTGTQSQWDALTSTQQATYTIALITE